MVAAGHVATEHSKGCQLNFSFQQMCFVASVEASTALESGLCEIPTDTNYDLFTDIISTAFDTLPIHYVGESRLVASKG